MKKLEHETHLRFLVRSLRASNISDDSVFTISGAELSAGTTANGTSRPG